jgi:hypothetical protein
MAQLKLHTRSQLDRSKAKALQQVEGYHDEFSEWFIVAQEKISKWRPAKDELHAMDEAYFRFSFAMHECSKCASGAK